jgi:hypothetical protein
VANDPENEAELTKIPASEILNKIQKGEHIEYDHVIIKGNIDISKLNLLKENENFIISSKIIITNSHIPGNPFFGKAIFKDTIRFDGSTFSGVVDFYRAMFSEDAYFHDTTFSGNANFNGAMFSGDAYLTATKFEGELLTFRNAVFTFSELQEGACRRAKNVLERNGNREEARYHFYREMEGKRKQKQWYFRYPKFVFIQLIFGYGVHPFRLMFCWFMVATIFAIFYLAKGGIISKLPASALPQPLSYFVECFYFSIVTAVTPGYGKYELASWEYQVIASIEAIFGTFMWAAFIATFARKYMR